VNICYGEQILLDRQNSSKDLLNNLSMIKGVLGLLWWEPFYNEHITCWLNGSAGLFTDDWKPLPALEVFKKYKNFFPYMGADISSLKYIVETINRNAIDNNS